jgi:DNA-directed RNA polymerase subunit RPC12/RpoP
MSDKELTPRQLAKLERIMSDGQVDVRCTARCGESATVEPDADYACPSCGKGRLVSPLVVLGFI